MRARVVIKLLFVLATMLCFAETGMIQAVEVKVAFWCFSMICFFGIFFQWGPLIPVTLLAFFVGQLLPDKHGYSHNAMEAVEHDWIDPTMFATTAAIVIIILQMKLARESGAPNPQPPTA